MTDEVIKRKAGRPKDSRSINGHRNKWDITVEQEAYARARAMGSPVKDAILLAGLDIGVPAARKWEAIPAVRRRIEELSEMATENAILHTGLNREWVISRLMSIVERCMQAEEVRDNEGNPTGEYQFDSKGANQALKMLGDTMGMFQHRDKAPDDDYANLSDEDIARIAADLAKEVGLLPEQVVIDAGST